MQSRSYDTNDGVFKNSEALDFTLPANRPIA